MNRQLRIFLAGVVVVLPFALTAYVVWWAGSGLDGLARAAMERLAPGVTKWLFPGAGALCLLAGIYVIGLLTHLWAFRQAVRLLEGLLGRLPMVQGIYRSIRDVMKLFGGSAERMGQVVRYRPLGTEAEVLAIRTNASPRAAADKVALYVPMSYQLGGYLVYVPGDSVTPVDMSVEEALRLIATAEVGAGAAQQMRGRSSP